ncbi:MAG: EAL domain-containing protein [Gammaproteobacteria bacterium]|nr:EAL domain-containing protein [Gammaproteobacteria bacterium]
MQNTITFKVITGIATIVFLCLIGIAIIFSALTVSHEAVEWIANVEEPISTAVDEMEINVVEMGMGVFKYINTSEDKYQANFYKDATDFDQFKVQYDHLAHSEQQQVMGLQLTNVYQEYRKLGEAIMKLHAKQEIGFQKITENLFQIQEITHNPNVINKIPKFQVDDKESTLLQIEETVKMMQIWLVTYLQFERIEDKEQVLLNVKDLEKLITGYRRYSFSSLELQGVRNIERSVDIISKTIPAVIILNEEMKKNIHRFLKLREEIDDALDGGLQALTMSDLNKAKLTSTQTSKNAKNIVLILIPIIVLFGMTVGWLVVRGVRKPVQQLISGAASIGSGDLSHRIEILGNDELGFLAQEFNRMAEKLEETLVSKEQLQLSQDNLLLSEERYQLAVNGANDGLWDWDISTGKAYYSSRWKSMLGYSDDDIGTSQDDFFKLIHHEDINQTRKALVTHLKDPVEHFESEYRIRCKNGNYRWVRCRGQAMVGENNRAIRMAGSQSDINDHKLIEQKLEYDAFHDSLTQLSNRPLLLERLQKSIKRSKQYQNYSFALLFLDMDNFKIVNDSLGHPIGDLLLASIARRLEVILRKSDTLARFGGDEFAILLDDLDDASEALNIAQSVHDELEAAFVLNQHEIQISASIGITVSNESYGNAEEMLRDADIAMYHAKSMGNANYHMFDDGLRKKAMQRLKLETELRRATEQNEFIVYYQPVVDLYSGMIKGFEALIRWQHPERGLIMPNEFIPIAEETGLIKPIGKWLLKEVCSQTSEWHTAGYKSVVSVNVSPVQLQDGLPDDLSEALKQSELDPRYLVIEITESSVMQNQQHAQDLLQELTLLGVGLAIDDFGTGYSCLSYLIQFPWSKIKIDQTFIRNIPEDMDNVAIIKAIISVARSLNLEIIAEGVETEAQLCWLKNCGRIGLQGHLFSKAVPVHDVIPMLKQTSWKINDKLEGFASGADDYLVKPFAMQELDVRLKALVRRVRGEQSQELLQVADLVFNPVTLNVKRDGKNISLPPIPLKILTLLIQQSPRVIPRNEIERRVWGDIRPESDALRAHMSVLRTAIDRPFSNHLLRTVHGIGYQLIASDEIQD